MHATSRNEHRFFKMSFGLGGSMSASSYIEREEIERVSIWLPDIPIWEVIVRALVTFFFLLVALRLTGKRDVGEMSPSDFILLLLLSANLHTSISGDDKSILGGLIGASSLIALNYFMNKYAARSKKFEALLKGQPEVIISHGRPERKVMERHALSDMQLQTALRKEHAERYEDVRLAVLEPDGEISVFKYSDDRKESLSQHRSKTEYSSPILE